MSSLSCLTKGWRPMELRGCLSACASPSISGSLTMTDGLKVLNRAVAKASRRSAMAFAAAWSAASTRP